MQYENCVILISEEKEVTCITRKEFEDLYNKSEPNMMILFHFNRPIYIKNPSVIFKNKDRAVFYLGDILKTDNNVQYVLNPVSTDKYNLEHVSKWESQDFITQREIRTFLESFCSGETDSHLLSTRKLFEASSNSMQIRYIAVRGLISRLKEQKFLPYRTLFEGLYDGFIKGWQDYKFMVEEHPNRDMVAVAWQYYDYVRNLTHEIYVETGIKPPTEFYTHGYGWDSGRSHAVPEYAVKFCDYMMTKQFEKKLLKDLMTNGYVIFELGNLYSQTIETCRQLTHMHYNETPCSDFCVHDDGLCTKQREWNITNTAGYRQLLLHPQILSIVEALYGKDNCHLTSFSTNTVGAHMSDVYWHVDHPYKSENINLCEHKPFSLQINISLDDFTTENGATMFVKGSHKMTAEQRENAEVATFVCKKGTALLYFGNLWHSAGENKTDSLRSILLANFTTLEYNALTMKNPKDVPISEQIKPDDNDFKIVEGKVFLK